MKLLAWAPASTMPLLGGRRADVGALCLSLVPGQDLDTMEESAEIKVDTSISRTSRMQSYLAASGKRISSALSYVTGEMKECGEGLKGKASVM